MLTLPLNESSFLDVGCGYAAILSIFAHSRGCRFITAIDIDPDCTVSAKQFLKANGVSAEVKLSDMATRLNDESFDIIAFNSTYIPEAWGLTQGLNQTALGDQPKATVRWSGGKDGTRSIRRFLSEMPPFLTDQGVLILGFNHFYVQESAVLNIVQSASLHVERVLRQKIGKSGAIVIRR